VECASFWKSIQETSSLVLKNSILGDSDVDNPGLIAFKDHWDAAIALTYWRCQKTGKLLLLPVEDELPKRTFARCLQACRHVSAGTFIVTSVEMSIKIGLLTGGDDKTLCRRLDDGIGIARHLCGLHRQYSMGRTELHTSAAYPFGTCVETRNENVRYRER
jgi:hypothetical protein